MGAKIRYFHASPVRFRYGDILTGGHEGGAGYKHWDVCMTNSPVPHATISDKVTRSWHVYEVEPLYRVGFCEGNGEYQTKAARVIRRVGNAKAILDNYKRNQQKKHKNTPLWKSAPGSYVHPRRGRWASLFKNTYARY